METLKMQTEILTFLNSNWHNIIVALLVSTIFYILPNYAHRKYITSVERVKIKQAKTIILDILEARVISKQDIPLDKIYNLLEAIEREHSVFLSDVTPETILQDLELQFEKSHHLDPNQKEEYCKRIQKIIQEDETAEEELIRPIKYSEIFETLTEEITSKNTDKALENLELLKKKMSERGGYISVEKESSYIKLSKVFVPIIIIYSVIQYLTFDLTYIMWILGGIVVVGIIASIIGAFVFGMGSEIEK